MRFISAALLVPALFSASLARADDCSAPTTDSEEFYLQAEGQLEGVNGTLGYVSEGNIYFASNATAATAQIYVNSSLILDNHDVIIGRNFLSVEPFSEDAEVARPFEIVDGYLKIYGGDFRAVDTGNYLFVLGSSNTMSGEAVKLRAFYTNGTRYAQDYVPLTAENITDPSLYKASQSNAKPQQPEIRIPTCGESASSTFSYSYTGVVASDSFSTTVSTGSSTSKTGSATATTKSSSATSSGSSSAKSSSSKGSAGHRTASSMLVAVLAGLLL